MLQLAPSHDLDDLAALVGRPPDSLSSAVDPLPLVVDPLGRPFRLAPPPSDRREASLIAVEVHRLSLQRQVEADPQKASAALGRNLTLPTHENQR